MAPSRHNDGASPAPAMEEFFNKYVDRLEKEHWHDDDPSFMMDDLVVQCSSPFKHSRQSTPVSANKSDRRMNLPLENTVNDGRSQSLAEKPKHRNKDPTLCELEFLVEQIERADIYSQKLIAILLKGLKSTLGDKIHQMFLDGTLPENWWPIIKFNNDNTPYVEFLIKSDHADEAPTSQINGHSAEHMALCQFIINHLYNCAKQLETSGHGTPSSKQSRKAISVYNPVKTETKKRPPPKQKCSTPISKQKQAPPTRPATSIKKPQPGSDTSKRVLPPRSCKSVSMIM